MEGLKAYGAGMASGKFDPLTFIRKPSVILRLSSWLFSIIVFGCVSAEGYHPRTEVCLYNNDNNACSFGGGIGVLAFLGLTVFLVVDAMFDNLSSIQQRKWVVIGDLGFSGFWTFMWFVCFCYLADAWRQTELDPKLDGFGVNNGRAAITFSFFSIFTFAGITYFAFMKYREGAANAFSPAYENQGQPGQPYSGYPGGPEATEPYQEPPFSQAGGPPGGGGVGGTGAPGDYSAPAY